MTALHTSPLDTATSSGEGGRDTAPDDRSERGLPPTMVERVSLILEAFQGPHAQLSLEQISGLTHLPQSTAHRILKQLVGIGWMTHSHAGYQLGPRGPVSGESGEARLELRGAAAELLNDLHLRSGMVVHLGVLEGAQVRYLDKVGGRFGKTVPSRVGGTAPAHCTGLGKAMLAWLPPEEVDDAISRPDRHTPQTIVELNALHGELHRIRQRNGLTFERCEYLEDVVCVAAAVRGPDRPVAAISMVAHDGAPLERAAPLVVDAARQVSATLFPGQQVRGRRQRCRA